MKTRAYKTGFTLIEMVVVIAIIAILVSMVVSITKRFDDQGKERLTRETITLLGNALEQFRDFGYEYQSSDYAGLIFPLDCNGYDIVNPSPPYPNIPATLQSAFGLSFTPNISVSGGGPYDPSFSGSEVLYFILRQVPDCRATLEKIDKSLLTNKDAKGNTITITIGASPAIPFTRIIDPWGTPLRYDYYPEYADYILANPGGNWGNYINYYRNSALKTFPVITSAGPDKQFDTADDISNVK